MAYIPGYAALATWNGTAVGVSGWDFDDGGDLVDVSDTTSSSNGIQTLIACLQRGSAKLTLWYNTTQTPAGLGLQFGAKGTLAIPATGDSASFRVAKVGKTMQIATAVGVQVELKQSN